VGYCSVPFVEAGFAILCFGFLLLFPGFGLLLCWASVKERRPVLGLASREVPTSATLAHAVGLSLILVVVCGYALVSARQFTNTRLALAIAPFAVLGLAPFVVFVVRQARSWWVFLALCILAGPFAAPALHSGDAPINNFNWYYWTLGKDLTVARGIPGWVSEYGMQLRWQPDYLSFSVLSEGFRGLFLGASDVEALSMWKVPVALFTVLVTYAAFRLWFRRPTALVGTALLLVTTLYTAKLGNARPEILGFALGLVALVIGIDAQRRLRPYGYLLAGAVLAISTSVHAIGALMAGVLLVAGTLCEVVADRRHLALRARITLGGVVVFAGVVTATGWALQGRLFVGADAAHPRLVSGSDPTLRYFQLSEGLRQRPDIGSRLARQLLDVVQVPASNAATPWVLAGLLSLCVLLTVSSGSRRSREALVISGGLALFLAAGAAWFGLRYSTFVPQNTGLSRFTQWAPLVFVLVAVCGIDSGLRRIGSSPRGVRIRRSLSTPPRARTVLVGALVVASAVAWTGVVQREFPARLSFTRESADAVGAIQRVVAPGDVLLTNLATHGILEYATSAEVPLEGRQPVIEDLKVLKGTNSYLEKVDAFFDNPEGTDPGKVFDARWVLVSDEPRAFGATLGYGPRHADLSGAVGLTRVWHAGHTSLYGASPSTTSPSRVGPAGATFPRFLAGLLICLAATGGAGLLGRRTSAQRTAEPARA
jgi:hypothetical protein